MVDFELSDLSRTQLLAAAVATGVVLGGGLTYLGLNLDSVSKQVAGQEAVSTLEAQTGQDLELINVKEENGLYKVNVKDSDNRVSTFYVTRDGAKIASNLVDLQRTKRVATARNELSSCLQESQVVMFGNASQRETLAQIQLLGGQRYVSGIYADVSNQQVLRQAVQLGVRRIPAFYYNGSVKQGITSPQQLANFTGCSYDITG